MKKKRFLVVAIFAITCIIRVSLTNVYASYQTPETFIEKDVDDEPASEEYDDKFQFAFKNEEGLIISPVYTYSTQTDTNDSEPYNQVRTYNHVDGINKGIDIFGPINNYLQILKPSPSANPSENYFILTLEELSNKVKNIKFDSKVYEFKCYYTYNNEFGYSLNHYEINGTIVTPWGELAKLDTNGHAVPVNPEKPIQYSFKFSNSTIKYVYHTVNVIWKDSKGETIDTPKDLTDQTITNVNVLLLKDGIPNGKIVEINNTDNWTFTWQELDDSYTWSVMEINVPQGYKCTNSVSKDGMITTLTYMEIPLPKQDCEEKPKDSCDEPDKRDSKPIVEPSDKKTQNNTNTVQPDTNAPVSPNKEVKHSVKTSDFSNIFAWSLILSCSFVSILFAIYIRSKTQHEHS